MISESEYPDQASHLLQLPFAGDISKRVERLERIVKPLLLDVDSRRPGADELPGRLEILAAEVRDIGKRLERIECLLMCSDFSHFQKIDNILRQLRRDAIEKDAMEQTVQASGGATLGADMKKPPTYSTCKTPSNVGILKVWPSYQYDMKQEEEIFGNSDLEPEAENDFVPLCGKKDSSMLPICGNHLLEPKSDLTELIANDRQAKPKQSTGVAKPNYPYDMKQGEECASSSNPEPEAENDFVPVRGKTDSSMIPICGNHLLGPMSDLSELVANNRPAHPQQSTGVANPSHPYDMKQEEQIASSSNLEQEAENDFVPWSGKKDLSMIPIRGNHLLEPKADLTAMIANDRQAHPTQSTGVVTPNIALAEKGKGQFPASKPIRFWREVQANEVRSDSGHTVFGLPTQQQPPILMLDAKATSCNEQRPPRKRSKSRGWNLAAEAASSGKRIVPKSL